MITGIDHIAIGVADIEKAIEFYTKGLNFRLGRRGTHNLSGKAIVFIHDPVTRVKIELIETEPDKVGFSHIAFNSTDIEEETQSLKDEYGMEPVRGPKRTEAAQMMTAHFEGFDGLPTQLCCYDEGAVDTVLPEE